MDTYYSDTQDLQCIIEGHKLKNAINEKDWCPEIFSFVSNAIAAELKGMGHNPAICMACWFLMAARWN